MADLSTPVQQIAAGANAAVRVNENFDAASPAMLYGRDARTTTGLAWGYIGGRWNSILVASGTVTLTANDTNYVVWERATGDVSVDTATTDWNDTANFGRAYLVETGSATVTAYEDHRQLGGDSAGGAAAGLTITEKSVDYTFVLADANTGFLHPTADAADRVFTIPANDDVPYPPGTAITVINQHGAGDVTIAITDDTMRLAGAGTTGSRTLSPDGVATALKITATEWLVMGSGLA